MKKYRLSPYIFVLLFSAICLLSARASSGRFSSSSVNESRAEANGYTGVWQGKYKGRTFVVLALSLDDRSGLKGRIAVGNVDVDENGEVNKVISEPNGEAEIRDVNVKDGVLTFKAKLDDDLVSYRMKIIVTGKSELGIDGAPSGMKPFTLERVAGHE